MKFSKLSLPLTLINFGFLLDIAKKLKKIPTVNCKYNPDDIPKNPVTTVFETTPPGANIDHNAAKKKHNFRENWKALVETLTLIVLVVTLVQVYKYTQEAGRQTKISRKLFQTSEKSYKLDQRAWIFMPQEIKVREVAFDKPLGVPLEIKNTGKTPAKTIYTYIAVDIVKPDDVINFSYEQGNKFRPHRESFYPFMFPKASHVVTHFAMKPGENPEKIIATPELIGEVNAENPKVRIMMHGRITYNDIFGDPHWIIFCSQSNPAPLSFSSKSGKQCANHNDIDTQK
jgi:hypothetical protein